MGSMTAPMMQPVISASEGGPIALGITGHRLERLAATDLAVLRTRVDGILAAVAAAVPGSRFRLVGSLAEGADMVAADAALGRGWQIDTVLPFARGDYAQDFDDAARCGFHDRLAASANVLELPGSRDEPGGEAAAYERAGRVVLSQVDVLLAVWDGDPPRGRGGAAQIVAEAVTHGIPVIVLDPVPDRPPVLLWSGLNDHNAGPETVDTVAQGGISDIPRLLARLNTVEPAVHGSVKPREAPVIFAVAYPLLLALAGVRRLRLADLRRPCPAVRVRSPDPQLALQARIDDQLWPRFDQADCEASLAAQMFRSAFVSSFALAALSVTLSLLGLIVPIAVKPLLAAGEFSSIALILVITRWGARARWHDRWLDQRMLAEELRCLAVSASLGDLFLRGTRVQDRDAAGRERRDLARRIGLPSARIDAAYLAATHASFKALLDDQISYVEREAGRMHLLEHRLHRLGAALFTITALICAGVLAIEAIGPLLASSAVALQHGLPLGVTVLSASLPAIGAAVYGIRMQGDFVGAAERNAALATQLTLIRTITEDEDLGFDGLRRLIRRTAELLTADVAQWVRATQARPLSLPG